MTSVWSIGLLFTVIYPIVSHDIYFFEYKFRYEVDVEVVRSMGVLTISVSSIPLLHHLCYYMTSLTQNFRPTSAIEVDMDVNLWVF